VNEEDAITAESIAEEFPGWEAWQGIDRLWHARIRGSGSSIRDQRSEASPGATPPVMVHGEDLLDLRDQIKRWLSRTEAHWHSK